MNSRDLEDADIKGKSFLPSILAFPASRIQLLARAGMSRILATSSPIGSMFTWATAEG